MDFTLDYGKKEKDFFTSLTAPKELEYSFGANVKGALYGFGTFTKRPKNALHLSNIHLRKVKNNIYREIEKDNQKAVTLKETLSQIKNILSLHKKRHVLTKKHYMQGRINYSDYLNSSKELQFAQKSYLTAFFNLQMTYLKQNMSNGTFLNSETIK